MQPHLDSRTKNVLTVGAVAARDFLGSILFLCWAEGVGRYPSIWAVYLVSPGSRYIIGAVIIADKKLTMDKKIIR